MDIGNFVCESLNCNFNPCHFLALHKTWHTHKPDLHICNAVFHWMRVRPNLWVFVLHRCHMRYLCNPKTDLLQFFNQLFIDIASPTVLMGTSMRSEGKHNTAVCTQVAPSGSSEGIHSIMIHTDFERESTFYLGFWFRSNEMREKQSNLNEY